MAEASRQQRRIADSRQEERRKAKRRGNHTRGAKTIEAAAAGEPRCFCKWEGCRRGRLGEGGGGVQGGLEWVSSTGTHILRR